MAYKFNDEDKSVADQAERMPFGVNRVYLIGATAGETDAGKDFVELTFKNDDEIEDTARVWFTGGASKYSFATLRQIAVHNAKDAEKESVRLAVESCKDNDELVALLNKNVVGGEFWVEKYYDPISTYTGTDGNEYRSVNRNIRGYEPKLKPELLDKPADAVQSTFPGAEPVSGKEAADIPADNAWGK